MDKFEGDMVESLKDMLIQFGRAKYMQGVHAQADDLGRASDSFNKANHYLFLIENEILKMQSQQPAEQKMQHDPNAGMQLNHGVIEKPVELTAEQRAEADRLCRQYLGGDRFWLR